MRQHYDVGIMNQQEKWLEYWKSYLFAKHGKTEVEGEDDLFLQVARTVNKKPISKEAFAFVYWKVSKTLELKPSDILIDFCCGNGLFTYEFRDTVSRIIGVDFADQIIETARRLKSAPNIEYCHDDILSFLATFETNFPGVQPTKYMMLDSIAYFNTDDLRQILQAMIRLSPNGFIGAFRGAPNDDLKWNYYTTDEWKQRYIHNVISGDFTNDGLGRWWTVSEIETLCRDLGISCTLTEQDHILSNYRTDILVHYKQTV